ncbi:MAG: nucleotidyltransferase domain-containing protein [Actinomycetia bacterium]|nr:nucleotidyltransferase domain-containing protein [Actinomycetes bacterium]
MAIDEQKIKQKLAETCPKLGISLVYLFGSAARKSEDFRDIDIAVLVETKQPDPENELEIAAELKSALEEEIESSTPLETTPLNSANALLRFESIKEGKCLYARSEEERIGFEMKTIREYGDYKAKSRIYEQAIKDRLKKKLA